MYNTRPVGNRLSVYEDTSILYISPHEGVNGFGDILLAMSKITKKIIIKGGVK